MEQNGTELAAQAKPTFGEAFRFWLKLGFISFGGPAGQIAIMHTEVVERRRWISEEQFLHALNYCMLLPGPEAQQLATYIGWLLHRTKGGIVAGTLFVLPSAAILLALSWAYMRFGTNVAAQGFLWGLKCAVAAIVIVAAQKIGRKALKTNLLRSIALGAFVAIFFFNVPYPLVLAFAAVGGYFSGAPSPKSPSITRMPRPLGPGTGLWRAVRILGIFAILWAGPPLLVGMLTGWHTPLTAMSLFFSKAAMMTFGGAYAVLPYVSQQAVQHYQWLGPAQMMDGLGLAETTPGPLIMVLQFVGFVGAWNHPGNLPPLLSGTLGAFLTTWCTFIPCFLWIFLGAPYVEALRENATVSRILTGVTSSVAGVVANLALWFTIHLFFPSRVDWLAMLLAAAAFVALLRYRIPVVALVLGAGVIGVIKQYCFGLVA